MQAKKKKTKKKIKVQDLEPPKIPKGVCPRVLPRTLSGF